jgi:hypothetical protein
VSLPRYTLPKLTIGHSNIFKIYDELRHKMSRVADFDRSTEGMKELFDRVDKLCGEFFEVAEIGDKCEVAELFKLYDTVLTQRSVLSAMLASAKHIGTHGSAVVDKKRCALKGAPRKTRTITLGAVSTLEPVSPMPEPELWFETLLARKKQEMDNGKV